MSYKLSSVFRKVVTKTAKKNFKLTASAVLDFEFVISLKIKKETSGKYNKYLRK
jgi:hypothetical protein